MVRKKDIESVVKDYSAAELLQEVERRQKEENRLAEAERARLAAIQEAKVNGLEKQFREAVKKTQPLMEEQVSLIRDAYSKAQDIASEAKEKLEQMSEETGISFEIFIYGVENSRYIPESFSEKWSLVDKDVISELGVLAPTSWNREGWYHSQAC